MRRRKRRVVKQKGLRLIGEVLHGMGVGGGREEREIDGGWGRG
jgi:hypothetical protein